MPRCFSLGEALMVSLAVTLYALDAVLVTADIIRTDYSLSSSHIAAVAASAASWAGPPPSMPTAALRGPLSLLLQCGLLGVLASVAASLSALFCLLPAQLRYFSVGCGQEITPARAGWEATATGVERASQRESNMAPAADGTALASPRPRFRRQSKAKGASANVKRARGGGALALPPASSPVPSVSRTGAVLFFGVLGLGIAATVGWSCLLLGGRDAISWCARGGPPFSATPRHSPPRHDTTYHGTTRHTTARHDIPRHGTPRRDTTHSAEPLHATPCHLLRTMARSGV